MAEAEKNIVYLDHDAEITEAIEKLKATEGETVRLVVPARSGLLQSVVNLKLLHKAAKDDKKDLVLITSDKAAATLAGKIGLATAKNLKSTPHIVAAEPEPTRSPLVDDDDLKAEAKDDNMPVHRYDADEDGNSAKSKSGNRANKKSKIPNYNKFQLWIWIGAAVVALFLVGWLASAFLQTATINIQAAAEKHDVTATIVVSSTQNAATTIVAVPIELTKDLSQSYTATGKKDNGTKSTGTVTVKNCEDSIAHALPAGSKLTTGSKSYLSTADVSIPAGSFSGGGTVCNSTGVAVAITATDNGDSFNFSNANFALTGLSSRISGVGTTQGGTSKIADVVAQADIDNAQKTAIEGAKAQALVELTDKAKSDQKVFDDTLTVTVVSAVATPPAGAEAASGTLAVKAKYSILAVKKSDLEAAVKAKLKTDLTKDDDVLDAGLDQAEFKQIKSTGDQFTYELKTVAYTGRQIDKATVARDTAGKPKKDVADIVRQYPNVTGATVDGWPLVSQMPANANNIKVEIKVSK